MNCHLMFVSKDDPNLWSIFFSFSIPNFVGSISSSMQVFRLYEKGDTDTDEVKDLFLLV